MGAVLAVPELPDTVHTLYIQYTQYTQYTQWRANKTGEVWVQCQNYPISSFMGPLFPKTVKPNYFVEQCLTSGLVDTLLPRIRDKICTST